MRLHARYLKVNEARLALSKFFWEEIIRKHELTYLEGVQVLTSLIDEITKYGIRAERHPNDPDKKGDEA